MCSTNCIRTVLFWTTALIGVAPTRAGHIDPVKFNFEFYRPPPGLIAQVKTDTLIIDWQGENQNEIRMCFVVKDGTPTISELKITASNGSDFVLAKNVEPEFRIVSGIRRVTQQQTEPLEKLGVPLSIEVLNDIKWNAFWDAPLYLDDDPPLSHGSSIPAVEPYLNHPGMPRKADEIIRARATYNTVQCHIKTNGARLEIVFPGVEIGLFKGLLQYDIFKGSNLVRQMLIAKTENKSIAFKYDGGLSGLPIQDKTRILWRDLVHQWQDYKLGGPDFEEITILKTSNRLITTELQNGSIAVFPPPHSFYWARETEENLGYSWYRKDSDTTFSFGMRQAETESNPEFYHNFALYNARPGYWQRMPVFLYFGTSGHETTKSALAFTRGDRFKALDGYKVMGTHYHVGLVSRLKKLGGFHQRLNDIETMKGIGIDIYGVIDGVRGPGRHDTGEAYLKGLSEYYEAARSQSDKDFLVMPNDENSTGGRRPFLGGHYDILISKPIFWQPARQPDQPLSENHPQYGKVYHLGSPEDLMRMCELENVLISMPHPRAKGSTGYPDSIKHLSHFLHPNYFALGYRWGMGIDASETRLGEYRFLNLWDETNNWMANDNQEPKYALAISEARSDYGDRGKPPYDDPYGMAPVNYLQIDEVPKIEDMSSIINALKKGKYFVTSGEVLISQWNISEKCDSSIITAEIEWTFPLEFVEVVWGDGFKTDRKIISTTDLPPFGKKKFEIPFDARGKEWVRLAAWDIATNGAMVQPVRINCP